MNSNTQWFACSCRWPSNLIIIYYLFFIFHLLSKHVSFSVGLICTELLWIPYGMTMEWPWNPWSFRVDSIWRFHQSMGQFIYSMWNPCGIHAEQIPQNGWDLTQKYSIWNGWNPYGMDGMWGHSKDLQLYNDSGNYKCEYGVWKNFQGKHLFGESIKDFWGLFSHLDSHSANCLCYCPHHSGSSR